jgi:eukaryotic-like serine/threonine-protein kinase
MGEVYLARDTRLQRNVAIKHLRGDLPDGDWQERMRHEAQLLAQLNHPNIVQIYDIVEHDGVPALVMEYVDGRNLHIHLREHRVDLGERLRWLAEISAGIAASHAEGIVHCDLKAENVLVSPAGIAKVTDFGIASDRSDPAADVEALGRLAEELLKDYAELVPPTLTELLTDLVQQRPGKRPDALQAAERFKRAWYEYSQNETPLPQDIQPVSSWARYRLWIGTAVALIAIAIGAAISLQGPQDIRYVAVAPVEISSEGNPLGRQHEYLRAAVSQALRQSVLETPYLALVSYRATDLGEDSARDQLASLEADHMVTSSLRCEGAACDLVIERLDAPDGSVARHGNTTVLLSAALESSDLVNRHWGALFPEIEGSGATAFDTNLSEAQYQQFLDYYLAYEQFSMSTLELLQGVESLVAEVDGFIPLYKLYTDVAIHAYEDMGDLNYLDRLESSLREGSRLAQDPALLDICWFDLHTARDDFELAAAVVERMNTQSTDPALTSFLQGELRFSVNDFEGADRHYSRAVAIYPSMDYLYARARNGYYAGDQEKTGAYIEQILQRYPYNSNALNLKGIYLMELGQLDAAIEVFNQSLALQADPLQRANLGAIYMMQGDYQRARDQFQIAYEDDSRDSVLVLNLADTESLLGNQTRANELYNSLVRRSNKGDPSVLPEVAAQAFAQVGQFEQALTILRQHKTEWAGRPFYAYAAALVYTLAAQNISALIEVDNALQGGLDAIFFDPPWFDRLCGEQRFVTLMHKAGNGQRCESLEQSPLE